MFYKVTILSFSLLMLGGCATHYAGLSKYEPIEITEFDNLPPEVQNDKEFSSLIIKRDSGFRGSALPAKIHLDGLLLTNIKEGHYLQLKVTPGPHTLLLKTNGVGLVRFSHRLEINVSSGSTNYYRIHSGWPEGMTISESSD